MAGEEPACGIAPLLAGDLEGELRFRTEGGEEGGHGLRVKAATRQIAYAKLIGFELLVA